MNRKGITAWISVCVILLTACAAPDAKKEEQPADSKEIDTGYVVTGPESYDSFDTPVVAAINNRDQTVSFLNLDTGKQYTLHVDGTSKIYDKYGEALTLTQMMPGDIVDVTFLKSTKHLVRMSLSSNAWKYENVEKYSMDTVQKSVSVGNNVYKLSEYAKFFSNGRAIELMELNSADILTFQGIDNTILSATVEKGHGYLRLVNAESFVGGWIELGQKQIQRITEDMLITAPEGSYEVNISYKGSGGTKSVVIHRDEETALDIGDFKIAEPQTGTVLFSLTPAEASLYVDGVVTDASLPVVLEYGIHQLIARADGYQTLTQYLRVGEASAGVNIVLDEVVSTGEDGTESSSSLSTVSGNDASSAAGTTDTTTNYYKVYIDAPEKAEVYVDGNYVGIVPVSFKKTAGTHVIILRRNGYETRSYTIQVDSEEKDISYSFTELEENVSSSASLESILSEAFDTIINGN